MVDNLGTVFVEAHDRVAVREITEAISSHKQFKRGQLIINWQLK